MRRFRSSIVQCGVTNVCALAPTVLTASATRFLNVHEYSAKQLLRDAGCRVEYGVLCETIDEVRQACGKISTKQIVVKSQILAGGRGKGRFLNGFQGGVHVCEDASAAIAVAQKMLGETLVTKQTGPEGSKVTKLYLCEVLPKIKKEYYVAFLLDRTTQGPLFIASTEGGMDIEAVAEKTPEKIIKYPIDVVKGLTLPEAQDIAVKLRLENPQAAAEQFVALYQLASKRDATMVEINPFIATSEDQYMCIDAKISFDDNAEFRQSDVWKHEDISQKDPREVAASKWNLNYVGLDGNVGCLVNGAGLAMATMDIISMHGGKPANFLDVGGSANADQVTAALEIIQKDQKVKGILVNIFGGIMKCDTIAKGVVEACRRVGLRVPLVVRLSGTNSEEGKTLLRESALPVHPADDLDEAAGKMMSLIKN